MFKTASIKNLLQLWSLGTIVIIIALIAMGWYTNSLLNQTQQQVLERVIPTKKLTLKISNLASELAIRKGQLLTTDLVETDLEQLSTQNFEQLFNQYWQQLDQALNDQQGQQIARQFKQSYSDFIGLDQQLINTLNNNKQYKQAISKRTQVIERWQQEAMASFAELQNNSAQQALPKLEITFLKYSNLLSEIGHSHHSNQSLSALSQQINASITEFKQLLPSVKRQLGNRKQLDVIISRFDAITKATVEDKNGLYPLHLEVSTLQSTITDKQKVLINALTALVNDINKLSTLVQQQSVEQIEQSRHIANKIRIWGLITVVLLAILLGYFLNRITKGIQEPLIQLHGAMRTLASGQFDVRLERDDYHDEFKDFASDFNQFAAITHMLINDLDKARLTLQDREAELRTILNGVPEAIIILTEEGSIESMNPYAEKVLKASNDELLGQPFTHFFDEKEQIDNIERLVEKQEKNKEFQGLNYESQAFSMWLSINPIITQDKMQRWVCVISDVTSWKETELQLKQTSSELDSIFQNAMVGIAFMKDRKLLRVNNKFEDIFGYSKDEIIGHSPRKLCVNDQAFEQLALDVFSTLEKGNTYEDELEFVKKNGDRFWCDLSSKALSEGNPQEGTLWIYEDITKQRESDEKLRDLASLDTLTRLPNRSVFNDRLLHAIHKSQRDAQRLAIFFLDLDHFKHINDSLGHKAGDQLLCEVAKRLKACIREGDTVARLGGDEFTILLEDIQSVQYVAKVAEKVLESVVNTYTLGSTEVNVSPSIGISLYPADGRDVDTLVRNADAAMYHAKNTGRNNFQFYSAEMNAQAAHRLAMETSLRRAVENQDFYLHFQPQIDLITKQITGAEVLLRWRSEQWGEVSPAEFIPILEDTGLIGVVGEFVLSESCKAYMNLADKLDPDFKIAVNLSGRQFKGGLLAKFVKQTLTTTNMSARNLELEITESILMEDTDLAIKTLTELSDLGVTLAVDDFGTGYSSLSYLKQFPLNILKIDKSFIDDVTEDGTDDAAIVDAILAMSGHLKLEVVAEGIETLEQLHFLEKRQCQRGQGYFFSRPLNFHDFENLVDSKMVTL